MQTIEICAWLQLVATIVIPIAINAWNNRIIVK